MISSLNSRVWLSIEESLTPRAPNSKEWFIAHYLPAPFLLPIGAVTLTCDIASRSFYSALSICFRDRRDPNRDFQAVCDDSRKWKEISKLDVAFDKDFKLGTATCTWQDSGAVNCPDSQWSAWEKKVVAEGNRSGKSSNIFELYKTAEGRASLIEKLKKFGCNSYRFSIEWSLIEAKQGQYNDVALQVFVNLCKDLKRNGIEPLPTLHHFSEPQWFHDLGSFEKEENIVHFINFCKKVYPALTQNYWFRPLVNHICTINEPGVEAFSRYVRGAFSPGYYFRFDRAGKFLKGMLKAHCAAYTALKEMNPNIQIGIVHQRLKMEAANPLMVPATRYINRLVNDTTLNFFKTKVFEYKMPFSSHIREEGLDPKTDFVGLQYYSRPLIGFTGSTSYHEPMTQMPFREDPEGLYEAILEVYDAFEKPLIITENGVSTHHEEQRTRYNERALYAAYRGADKIGFKNLRGYFSWGSWPNSEWDMGMKPQDFSAYCLNKDGTIADEPKAGMKPLISTALASRNKELKTA